MALLLLLLRFIEIRVFHANIVDADHMPRSVSSDLGLHCLPVDILANVKCYFLSQNKKTYFYLNITYFCL